MADIVNRVAQSALVTLDLEDYYPVGPRKTLDIKDWLFEGIILKEKEFRQFVAEHNWSQYEGAYVAIGCSTEAIVPGWAYMLISSRISPYSKSVVKGDLEDLETAIFQKVIADLDVSQFRDKPVIIKGCTNKPIPENAYLWATEKIQKLAKSVMYGEACSSVPIYKRNRVNK